MKTPVRRLKRPNLHLSSKQSQSNVSNLLSQSSTVEKWLNVTFDSHHQRKKQYKKNVGKTKRLIWTLKEGHKHCFWETQLFS